MTRDYIKGVTLHEAEKERNAPLTRGVRLLGDYGRSKGFELAGKAEFGHRSAITTFLFASLVDVDENPPACCIPSFLHTNHLQRGGDRTVNAIK